MPRIRRFGLPSVPEVFPGRSRRYPAPGPSPWGPGSGRADPAALRRALRRDTRLVSVMHAASKTGTVQPVEEIARIAGEAGVTFHCGAVQTGKIPIPVERGLIAISARKFHGPKGAGAMVVKDASVPLQKLVSGGEQEHGLRSGTGNVLGIAGPGLAAGAARQRTGDAAEQARRRESGELLRAGLASVPGAVLNSPAGGCLAETGNVSLRGVRGDTVAGALSARGVAAPAGSACHPGQPGPSHVLTATGLPPEQVRGAVRFSASFLTTHDEIEYLAGITDRAV